MVLIPPPQIDQPLLDTPCPVLCVLCLFPGPRRRVFVPKKEQSQLPVPLFSSHILSFPIPCLTQQSLAGSTAETQPLISWPSKESKVINLKSDHLGTLLDSAECRERELFENLDRKKHGKDTQNPRVEMKGRKRAELLLSVKTEQLQKELRKKRRKTSPKLEKSDGLKISEGPPLQPQLIPVCPLFSRLGTQQHFNSLVPRALPTRFGTHSSSWGQLSCNSRISLSCYSRNIPLWSFNFKSRSAGAAWSQCTGTSGILLGLRLADSCFSPRSHKLT